MGTDPVATWGLIIASIGALGVVIGGGTWRALGKIEGKIERYAERLQRHSDKIDEHDVAIVRINGLPRQIQDLEKHMASLSGKVDILLESMNVAR